MPSFHNFLCCYIHVLYVWNMPDIQKAKYSLFLKQILLQPNGQISPKTGLNIGKLILKMDTEIQSIVSRGV